MTKMTIIPENYNNIRAEIVELLKAARSTAARNVNSIMTATYWEIGGAIVEQELKRRGPRELRRTTSGTTCQRLDQAVGRGFGNINLWRMRAFYRAWSEGQILSTLSKESCKLLPFNNISPPSASISTLSASFPCPGRPTFAYLASNGRRREFFMKPKLSALDGLSVNWIARSAANSTNGIAPHRTKPPCWRRPRLPKPSDAVTPEEAIKDPFVLEFLDLKDEYSESDLEEALIQRLTDFLLELGDDFAFLVANAGSVSMTHGFASTSFSFIAVCERF